MKTKSILIASILALTAAALTPAHAATTILHSFDGIFSSSGPDGSTPYDSLTLSGTTLYGLTYAGGSNTTGALFKMNTNGTGFGLLHNFIGGVSDGRYPLGALTLSGSKFYGMTSEGGTANAGTVFSMNTNGTGYGLLRSFAGGTGDGRNPFGTLTLSGTKLYGMTSGGGSSDIGTVFSMNTDGTGYGLLHTFTSSGFSTDGTNPGGSLTLSGTKLYGMARNGGAYPSSGVVFSMNIDGTGFALLHNFYGGTSDGAVPEGSLTLSGTKLYGMASVGGSNGKGTLFSMNTDGTGFSLLHSFAGGPNDGDNPLGSLTLSGTTLYGMTNYGGSLAIGGSTGYGTLFSINTNGTGFSLLESFNASSAGAFPAAGAVTLSGDGSTLYGMTSAGGNWNQGVAFSRSTAPEPASAALLGLGALLLAARRRL